MSVSDGLYTKGNEHERVHSKLSNSLNPLRLDHERQLTSGIIHGRLVVDGK